MLDRLGMHTTGDREQAQAIVEAHQGGEISDQTYAELKAQTGWPPAALLP